MEDIVVQACRDDTKQIVYWGYIGLAALRFGFSKEVVEQKLDYGQDFPCVSNDPLNDGKTTSYTISQWWPK